MVSAVLPKVPTLHASHISNKGLDALGNEDKYLLKPHFFVGGSWKENKNIGIALLTTR
jgi:hypothetical protein